MRLDSVTAEIRPRSDWEAVDLGFAMVRRSFWRCITVWWLAMAVPFAVAAVLLWNHPIWLLALFWWAKPAGSRMVLFELSRRLFGEKPRWRSVWRQIPRAWARRFFYRFVWARLSPWLPITLAVEDLEGLRGKAYKQRCRHVVRRGEGVMMWMYFLVDIASVWLGLGLLVLVMMLMPQGQDSAWQQATEGWTPEFMGEMPLLVSRLIVGCVMVAMSLTDVFVTGAGFGVYINNRTWIEGWDVELAFKRLAQRLGPVALVVVAFCLLVVPARAVDRVEAREIIQEVKAHEDFKVHSVTERVPKSKPKTRTTSMDYGWLKVLMQVLTVSAVMVAVGFLGWAIWRNRHVFRVKVGGAKDDRAPPRARVVMGMELSPDSLPPDIPTAAWTLWQQGRHHQALALLYRGSISRAMVLGRVEILESDTEGDCLRRVEQAGSAAQPEYFRAITGMWMRLAYAGVPPADAEVDAHCRQWPFGNGGPR